MAVKANFFGYDGQLPVKKLGGKKVEVIDGFSRNDVARLTSAPASDAP
jgi:hypothetical protein